MVSQAPSLKVTTASALGTPSESLEMLRDKP